MGIKCSLLCKNSPSPLKLTISLTDLTGPWLLLTSAPWALSHAWCTVHAWRPESVSAPRCMTREVHRMKDGTTELKQAGWCSFLRVAKCLHLCTGIYFLLMRWVESNHSRLEYVWYLSQNFHCQAWYHYLVPYLRTLKNCLLIHSINTCSI